MSNPIEIQKKFNDLACCVLIPTYNNATTLRRVIDEVLLYTENLIIINDGATDDTTEILKNYSEVSCQIHLKENQGKGSALRLGLKKAFEKGYNYAISIDSDGQHFSLNFR